VRESCRLRRKGDSLQIEWSRHSIKRKNKNLLSDNLEKNLSCEDREEFFRGRIGKALVSCNDSYVKRYSSGRTNARRMAGEAAGHEW